MLRFANQLIKLHRCTNKLTIFLSQKFCFNCRCGFNYWRKKRVLTIRIRQYSILFLLKRAGNETNFLKRIETGETCELRVPFLS